MAGRMVRIGAMQARLDARTINKIVTQALGRKAQSITKDPDTRQAIGEVFIKHTNRFVPLKSGKLRDSGHAEKDGRVYWTAISSNGYNYAGVQYDGGYIAPDGSVVKFENYTTEGTGPEWDQAMLNSSAYNDFIDDVIPLIRRRFEDGNR